MIWANYVNTVRSAWFIIGIPILYYMYQIYTKKKKQRGHVGI